MPLFWPLRSPPRSLDRDVRRRVFVRIPTILGWIATVFLGVVCVAEITNSTRTIILLVAQALLPILTFLGGSITCVAGLARKRLLTATSGVLSLCLLAYTLGPTRPFEAPTLHPSELPLTLAFSNTLDRGSSPDKARSILDVRADLVVAVEASDSFFGDMATEQAVAFYPYSARAGQNYQDRSGLWSRYPIISAKPGRFGHSSLLVTLDVAGKSLQILVVHVSNGATGSLSDWERDLRSLANYASTLTGPVLVVGDFNATLGHPALREMQRVGFREVHSWLGGGLRPSWPLDRGPIPPLMRIDHGFAKGGVLPLKVSDFTVPESDHRAFLIRFIVRAEVA